MRLFFDTSALLAGCGRATGAAAFILRHARILNWQLLTSDYVIRETEKNLSSIGDAGKTAWEAYRPLLEVVPDVLFFPWPVVFPVPKDRPVLFTAAASADVLLTLDRRDFLDRLGTDFYGMPILKPGSFLAAERRRGNTALARLTSE